MNSNQTKCSNPEGALPAGTRLEEFVIEHVLGVGGFGITYLARDTSLTRQVVIKENLPAQFCFREARSLSVVPNHTSGGDVEDFEWSMRNFLREAETLASLDHPGVVQVLRKFEANGTAYFVMPFVEGVGLDSLANKRGASRQDFTEVELRGLLDRTLDALSHLHDRGIYHRDIKPANILITSEGIPILIDFGAARQRISERSMTVVESPGYTPLEQLQSRGNVGPWSDLYALGGTLYRLITGESPPKAMDRAFGDSMVPLTSRRDLAGRFSVGFLTAIDRALKSRVEDRWQDPREWQSALRERVAVDLPLPVRPRMERVSGCAVIPNRKVNRLPWIIAGCVVMGLIVLAMNSSNRIAEARTVTGVDNAAVQRERAKAEATAAQAREAEQRATRAEKERLAVVAQADEAAMQPAERESLEELAVAKEIKVREATKDRPFVNPQGMKFVPAGTPGVLFCVWETRVKDFRAFVNATGHDAIKEGPNGLPACNLTKLEMHLEWKQVGGSWKDPRFPPGHGQGNTHPVVCVSYLDAEAFCAWLTKRDADQLPSRWRYRLPTDAEWSAACGSAEFPWGDGWPPSRTDGNYSGTETMVGPVHGWSDDFSKAGRSDGWVRTAPVGNFTQNRYGLFDMGGNVWEWCAKGNEFSMNKAETQKATPEPMNDGRGQAARVSRGGSWFDGKREFVSSACRPNFDFRDRVDTLGFRVVLAGGG